MERWLRAPFSSALATAVLAVAAIYFAEPVLAPLAVAGLLSVALGGAVKSVERLGFGRLRLGRIGAVLVVAIGVSAGFAAIGWIVASEGSDLAARLPEYRRNLLEKVRAPIASFVAARRLRARDALSARALSAQLRTWHRRRSRTRAARLARRAVIRAARSLASLHPVRGAAGTFADEIVSATLARLLASRGIEARSFTRLLTSELVEAVSREGAALLCLSALDSRAAPVRHLVKRLRISSPGSRIVVGFWGEDADRLAQLRESLGGDARVDLATTIGQAVELLADRARQEGPRVAPAA